MENSMSITTILERERELDDLVKVCLDELEVIDIHGQVYSIPLSHLTNAEQVLSLIHIFILVTRRVAVHISHQFCNGIKED